MLQGPIELAVIGAGARLAGQEAGTPAVSPDFMQEVNTLEAAIANRCDIAAELTPASSKHDLQIPLMGQEAQTALALVAMNARRHPNLVTKAAAMAMEQDFYQE